MRDTLYHFGKKFMKQLGSQTGTFSEITGTAVVGVLPIHHDRTYTPMDLDVAIN